MLKIENLPKIILHLKHISENCARLRIKLLDAVCIGQHCWVQQNCWVQKIGFYDGHESMQNGGGKTYVDRRSVRRSTCVCECTARLHLIIRHYNEPGTTPLIRYICFAFNVFYYVHTLVTLVNDVRTRGGWHGGGYSNYKCYVYINRIGTPKYYYNVPTMYII